MHTCARQDFTIEAYEILELLCELIHERIRYLAQEQHCPNDMHEAICTLMYVLPGACARGVRRREANDVTLSSCTGGQRTEQNARS
jgi:hypothetical protein